MIESSGGFHIWLTNICCYELLQESIEKTNHQLGYSIGVPIWALQRTNFIIVIDNAYNVYQ